jgi:hypothetical protein
MDSSFTSQTSYSTVSSKSDLTNSDHLCINIEINRGNHMYLGDFNIINILSGVVGFTTSEHYLLHFNPSYRSVYGA